MFRDNIFGAIIEPAERLASHQARRLGVRHLHRMQPLDPQPGQPITLTLTTSGPQPYDAARCWWCIEPPGAPEPGDWHSQDLAFSSVEWDAVIWEYVRSWQITLPPLPSGGMLRYRLAARIAGSDTWVFADADARGAAGDVPFAQWVADDPPPAWARHAVVYHVFVDRFFPGTGRPWLQPARLDGFFGGTLRGVIEQLDYIQHLGCTAIWLSPVFASPSHHGYDATDLTMVEPRLGSNAELLELFAAAHARDMRVILDFVANHWSNQHPTFVSARSDPHSPYRDWYTWNTWPDDYKTYFGVRELPELNLYTPAARDYLLESAATWLRAGADGLRLDYAYGPPHDFWADFRRACRQANPDCWLFGEVIHHPDLLRSYAGRMDGVLDFPLARALRETFAYRTWDVARFEAFLAGHEAYFPPWFVRPSFLDNHDMNRILFAAGEATALVKLGALALCTLAGPPIIYYGTEVGVSQQRPIHGENSFGVFEEARQPMHWGADQDADLLDFFQRLLALRRAYPLLAGGARQLVHLDAVAGTYAYLRIAPEPEAGQVLAAFNLGTEAARLAVPAAGFAPGAADRLNGHAVMVSGDTMIIALPPHAGALVG